MTYEDQLKDNFSCSKCRCKEAVVRKVSISKTPLPKIIDSDKYLFVTCTSCGLTEVYDLKVYAKNSVPAKDKAILKNSVAESPSPIQKTS